VDDNKSQRSFFYQAPHPTSVASDDDRNFSTVLDEIANSGPGAFTFDPTLDIFSWGKRTSFVNEMLSWAFSWTPTPTRHPFRKYDTPSSSSSVSTLFTPSKPIDIPPSVMSKQREKIAPRRLLSGPYKSFFSAAKRLFTARDHFSLLPSSPFPNPQMLSTNRITWIVRFRRPVVGRT